MNLSLFLSSENCEAMTFSVSPRGNVSIKTLCSFDRTSMNGSDLVGGKMTVSVFFGLVEQ